MQSFIISLRFKGRLQEKRCGCIRRLRRHVTALLTLKTNWLIVKLWDIMINNDVLLFSAIKWQTPYKHAAPTLLAVASTTRTYHQIKILRRRL